MIEMRWLVPVEGEKRLQYRQKIDVTILADRWASTGRVDANMEWSDWRDVPLVAERDPSYP